MNLTTVKTAADLPFKGIELVKVDKNITEVVIGGKLRIRQGPYSGLQVLVDAPFETGKRFKLTATVEGFDPKIQYFEQRWDADAASTNFTVGETKIEEVEVQIDDAGNVIEAANDSASPTSAKQPELCDDMPF